MDLYGAQRWIYATLTGNVMAFAETRNWAALLAVMPLGILFGAIHALTPGRRQPLSPFCTRALPDSVRAA